MPTTSLARLHKRQPFPIAFLTQSPVKIGEDAELGYIMRSTSPWPTSTSLVITPLLVQSRAFAKKLSPFPSKLETVKQAVPRLHFYPLLAFPFQRNFSRGSLSHTCFVAVSAARWAAVAVE